MIKHIANIVTGSRIVFSILMLFFPVFSPWFYVLYLLCGLTDMTDGTIARKTNTVSTFGSRLDTAADFVFVSAALVKLLPAMDIPGWLWIWILIIALIKITNIISGFICAKRFIAEHTVMNKVTGLLLFLLPLTLSFIDLRYSAAAVCATAAFSAVQEGHYIRTGREIK
ncbi:MAG: CDP-alcohol phosphatidyltransferase family protein [Huintestinicola sp.]